MEIDDEAPPGTRRTEPRLVLESLDRVAARWGVTHALALPAVFESWPSIVGPALAEHTRPCSLRDGILVVEVDDPAWATQVRWLEHELLRKIVEVAATTTVTSIAVRVRPR